MRATRLSTILQTFVFLVVAVSFSVADDSAVTLWYRQPAAKWTEALPLGNGRLGAHIKDGLIEVPFLAGKQGQQATIRNNKGKSPGRKQDRCFHFLWVNGSCSNEKGITFFNYYQSVTLKPCFGRGFVSSPCFGIAGSVVVRNCRS